MSFKKQVKAALDALYPFGLSKYSALELLLRENPDGFINYFDSPETAISPLSAVGPNYGAYRLMVDESTIYNVMRLRDIGMLSEKDMSKRPLCATVHDNKIYAITMVRTITGWGLKESKDFIEGETFSLSRSEYLLLKEVFGQSMVQVKNDM